LLKSGTPSQGMLAIHYANIVIYAQGNQQAGIVFMLEQMVA
jgi:hypothetical protein